MQVDIHVSGYISVQVTPDDLANVMRSEFEDESHAAVFYARESVHQMLDAINSRDVDFSTLQFDYTEVQ